MIDGSVLVHRNDEEVAHIGPGGSFGGRGLLDNAPRNATVTTEVQSTILRIEGDVLLDALQSAPTVLSAIDRSNRGAGTGGRRARLARGRPGLGAGMSVGGATVVVISAGYEGKRRAHVRMAELGARLVIVDEPGHWSESLVAEGVAAAWLAAPVVGDADQDARAVLDALAAAGIRPDGVLTFWEDSVCVAARVAAALGLPGNPPEAVDAARSKIRTRELSAQLGLPTPRAQRVRSLDELFAAAAHVGFPAVVKPEFGASAVGCVRVDDLESLPGIYALVRGIVSPENDAIFRAGNDLLLEEYLDGVEFDVDLVMHEGKCLFASVSENWPTAEPSFQETGLHCPATHDRKAVRRLVDLCVQTVQSFGLRVRRAARRGQVHEPRSAHRRGERAHGRRADPRDRRGRVERRPHRGAAPQQPGLPPPDAEPPAAERRRQHHRARARDRSPERPAVRREAPADGPADAVLDVVRQLGSEVAGPDSDLRLRAGRAGRDRTAACAALEHAPPSSPATRRADDHCRRARRRQATTGNGARARSARWTNRFVPQIAPNSSRASSRTRASLVRPLPNSIRIVPWSSRPPGQRQADCPPARSAATERCAAERACRPDLRVDGAASARPRCKLAHDDRVGAMGYVGHELLEQPPDLISLEQPVDDPRRD